MSPDRFGSKYDRLYVAMVTPFKENYEVDESALRKLLQYFMQRKFIEAGGGIIINPEAGEIFYLSRKEKRRNVEIAVEECGDEMPIFAGVADLTTKDAVQVAIDAKDAGADGLFLIPPMGSGDVTNSWDPVKYPEIWIDMAKAEVDAVDLPAIAHPTAPVTPQWGVGLPVGAALQMCKEIPNIVGWKMTYSYHGGLIVAKALRALDRHVGLLRAGTNFFHEHLALGYLDGTVTGALNYSMELIIDHINAWKNNDIDEARRIWFGGYDAISYHIFSEFSRLHIRYKIATWLRGLIPLPYARPPMPKPKKDEILTIRNLLVKAGLNVIPDKDVNRLISQLHS